MIPRIYTLFEFISIPYENQHQTLNIKKIDRGQIKFQEYSITLLQPYLVNNIGIFNGFPLPIFDDGYTLDSKYAVTW